MSVLRVSMGELSSSTTPDAGPSGNALWWGNRASSYRRDDSPASDDPPFRPGERVEVAFVTGYSRDGGPFVEWFGAVVESVSAGAGHLPRVEGEEPPTARVRVTGGPFVGLRLPVQSRLLRRPGAGDTQGRPK